MGVILCFASACVFLAINCCNEGSSYSLTVVVAGSVIIVVSSVVAGTVIAGVNVVSALHDMPLPFAMCPPSDALLRNSAPHLLQR